MWDFHVMDKATTRPGQKAGGPPSVSATATATATATARCRSGFYTYPRDGQGCKCGIST